MNETEARLRRTYDTGPAPLLVVAPTVRELGGLRASRLDGMGVATLGIGEQAGGALRELLRTRPPKAVLSLGFSGGLAEPLRTGGIVVSDVVRGPDGQSEALDTLSVASARAALADAGLEAGRGDLLTIRAPLLSASAKRQAHDASRAAVVDMEGYWLARTAAEAKVSLVCVRAVLDEVSHDLPEVVARLLEGGPTNEWRRVAGAVRRPSDVGSLAGLAMRAWRARNALAQAGRVLAPALASQPR